MKFKSEFVNAIKLFVLLSLLFWSFTWNLSPDFDLYPEETPGTRRGPKEAICTKDDVQNQHSSYIKSLSTVSCESTKSCKTVSTPGALIPPFNEWKEMEMTKFEKSSPKEGSFHHPKKQLVRRKLNYASSKCGAKILASNREARHRTSVLSEKSDEYLLNPCRVRTWFIVELCDTVEATQVELANYELYSSSPKEFSVFWSEVYPTSAWHLLGTFEAKDRRTMQTFDLSVKNLGKFIKVIIYNHHGKEHYCPLSAIRVLGYSMVQKLEDIVDEENKSPNSISDNKAETQSGKNDPPSEGSIFQGDVTRKFRRVCNINMNTSLTKLCSLFFINCGNEPNITEKQCITEEPTCQFLKEILKVSSTICYGVLCSETPRASFGDFNAVHRDELREASYNKTFSETQNYTNKTVSIVETPNQRNKHHDREKSTKFREERRDYVYNRTILKRDDLTTRNYDSNVSESHQRVTDAKTVSVQPTDPIRLTAHDVRKRCICDQDKEAVEAMIRGKLAQELRESEDGIDSAGLIHKESVLFKLTARIKASEMDLNLINKYLQQLSQSYRQQMEDMTVLFNHTVKTIDAASEKASMIDLKQEDTLRTLESRMKTLNRKVDYLMNGQRDMLKRVAELHGFFLILEFIIISTVVTIFLNIFRRNNNNASLKDPANRFKFWTMRNLQLASRGVDSVDLFNKEIIKH